MTPHPGRAHEDSEQQREQTVLLREIADNTKIMAVKLFGSSDADRENNSGRLPKVEASAKKAHERLDQLTWKVIGLAGLIYGLAETVHLLKK